MGLAAPAAREDTAGVEGVVAVGEAAEVAEGVMGVVGTWEEPSRLAVEVEVGVTAVDGLKGEREKKHVLYIPHHWTQDTIFPAQGKVPT